MTTSETVSALLPVHAGVAASHLGAALDSIRDQTRPADEIVIVEDGPLGPDLLQELERLEGHPGVVRVRLAHNGGAGVANQAGLEAATGTWIVKADSDDLSVPTRFAKLWDAVHLRHLDLCGAAMVEFTGEDPAHRVGVRTGPATAEEIARRMRWNNPINHPTAFYRRELALAVGGYPPMRFMQDYVLFARLHAAGAVMANLPDELVLFRTGETVMRRRRDGRIRALERELQQQLVELGVITPARARLNLVLRNGARRLPTGVMQRLHRTLFMTPTNPSTRSSRPARSAGGASEGSDRG